MGRDAMPAKAELLAPGSRVGRYFLLRRLAIGGMAELHLACAEGLAGFKKVVVVKHVLPHLAADPDFVRLFLNEARLAATLDHPNIVQVTDIGETEGDYFYVMEYVHGRNARELLREGGSRGGLPLEVALSIVIGAAAGLHHAHEASDLEGAPLGLVHRDVSPANLLISYDGAVKLTDFGIAKAAARSTETIGGAVKGKIGYMSPEQCRGENVDRRSDLFALGVVLCELTTCERLFFADNDFAVLNKVMSGSFERPSSRIADYPPALEAIALRALASEPQDRYATADALRRDLEAFAHERRLRTSAATISDWMVATFGRPQFPRVEVSPSMEPGGPVIPTLVVTPEDDEPTTTVKVATPDTLVVEPRRRRSVAVGAALLIVAVAGAGAVWSATNDGLEGSADDPASSTQPRGDDAEPAVPFVERDGPVGTGLEVDAESESTDAAPDAATTAAPAHASPNAGQSKATRMRGKKPRKKASADRDLEALYPVQR